MNVLSDRGDQSRSDEMLREYLRHLVWQALDRRTKNFESLDTAEKIRRHQRKLRQLFVTHLGGFPDRTPLNAKVIRRSEFDKFAVENIVYESQPRFYVTANLYLPRSPGPHPAVLVPCGHTNTGKIGYQKISTLLAKNGIAALCFDPIGQGERHQFLDLPGNVQLPSTTEHMICGVSPIPLGKSLANYMIWDGIRGIDYLVSRPDIDPKRIGCTGNSGGGNMTSYLMALDPRITTAAPSCFITTTRRKNESPGPGDVEQNIHGQIAFGMDHADYILLRAPKPTLILSATRDYVPIEGAWESFRQAKRVYTRLGFPERITLIETDQPHGFSLRLREGSVRWMMRWLLGQDDPIEETELDHIGDEILTCTPHGQVLRLDGARSVADLNRELANELDGTRSAFQSSRSNEEIRTQIRSTAGIRALEQLEEPSVTFHGSIDREEYVIRKLVIESESGIQLPGLHFIPRSPEDTDKSSARLILYLHDQGKHIDAALGGPIDELVRDGATVLAIDLRGRGETFTTSWRYTKAASYTGADAPEFFIAYMLGRSFVGMRAEDVLVTAQYLSHESPTSDDKGIEIIAHGTDCTPALHAIALEPQLFQSLTLNKSLTSWSDVARANMTRNALASCVHDCLRTYDLPDLLRLASPNRVIVKSQVDALGKVINSLSTEVQK